MMTLPQDKNEDVEALGTYLIDLKGRTVKQARAFTTKIPSGTIIPVLQIVFSEKGDDGAYINLTFDTDTRAAVDLGFAGFATAECVEANAINTDYSHTLDYLIPIP